MAVIDSVKELVAAPSVCPEAEAAGEKWCDCPACAAGKAVLDNKEEL